MTFINLKGMRIILYVTRTYITLHSNFLIFYRYPSTYNYTQKMIGDQGIGTIDSNYYPDTSPEYLQKWVEGYALLAVIIVGATANLFSLIIIRNKELNLIRDFSRLLQSQVTF